MDRLLKCVEGTLEMSPVQIKAADILLKKIVPDLARQETRFVDEDGKDKDMTVTLNRIVYNAPDRDK